MNKLTGFRLKLQVLKLSLCTAVMFALIIMFAVVSTAALASGETHYPQRQRRWMVGLTYPGVTLGYQGERFGAELRGYTGNDIVIYGPRFSHYILSFNGGNLYWGADVFYISDFDGDLTEGDGYMSGAFIGIQKYLGNNFSLTFDSGPYYIDIKDDLSNLSVDGWEFVINSSINFHF